jgi:hypothetical protein
MMFKDKQDKGSRGMMWRLHGSMTLVLVMQALATKH